MTQAEYTIEVHSQGGPYRSEEFIGTRREARARGREIVKKNDAGKAIEGFRLHFRRYVDSVEKGQER